MVWKLKIFHIVQNVTCAWKFFQIQLKVKNTTKRNMSSTVCLPAMCKFPLFLRSSSLSSSNEGRLPSKVVFQQMSSSIKGCLPSKVIFHRKSSSMEGHLPSKVIFHQRSSSIKGCLPSMVFFQQRSSSIKSRLPWKVVFCQKLSSVKGCLPSNVVFLFWFIFIFRSSNKGI